ncbi:uncharacterized protein A1O9_03288 [Exophiala aquamarina CBS 119918]|uniref:Prephenate dehydratase n=1 Tax=Exophiala aquamarina CBS 119918 TaxID=1182545 RepID=A0A072PQW4_9EURO|nr:uncharacterized protein A1O9_03288 [Exophiala aquamarina CBS 119918]KEF61718.1 hypothetical protein A1O9_03288 [Exophiala aquamarina CBS 119918]
MAQQDTLHVAYLGPEASFSHQAALELFPTGGTCTDTYADTYTDSSDGAGTYNPRVTLDPLPSFSSIFSAIQQASSSGTSAIVALSSSASCPPAQPIPFPTYDYAVIPIENSTNGSVVQVFDLLAQCGLHDNDNAALYPDLQVCAEYYLPVHHCLFIHPSQSTHAPSSSPSAVTGSHTESQSPPLPDLPFPPISTLYTHPQVWGQCGRFLSKHFPAGVVERIDLGSTSAAAALVAREGGIAPPAATPTTTEITTSSSTVPTPPPISPTMAAISSRLAGRKHKLVCLAENIEDSPGENTTRFLVLRNSRRGPRYPAYHRALVSRLLWSPAPAPPSSADAVAMTTVREPVLADQRAQAQAHIRHKSLITFTIPHTKPGALADALAVFKTHGFNLTSIDTRPSRRRNWHYVFFVECEEALSGTAPDGFGIDTGGVGGLHDGGDDDDALGQNLSSVLDGLAKYTESLRYLGRFVDQLQSEEW